MSDAAVLTFSQSTAQLRTAIRLIAEFVSDSILDPHWGFKALYTGAGQYADDPAELRQLLLRLIETLDVVDCNEARLQQLDTQLLSHHIPPVAQLRQLFPAGRSIS